MKLLYALLIILFCYSIHCSTNVRFFNIGSLYVSVSTAGRIPAFNFTQDNEVIQFRLNAIYEIQNSDGNWTLVEGSQVDLNSLNWTYSHNGSYSFAITGYPTDNSTRARSLPTSPVRSSQLYDLKSGSRKPEVRHHLQCNDCQCQEDDDDDSLVSNMCLDDDVYGNYNYGYLCREGNPEDRICEKTTICDNNGFCEVDHICWYNTTQNDNGTTGIQPLCSAPNVNLFEYIRFYSRLIQGNINGTCDAEMFSMCNASCYQYCDTLLGYENSNYSQCINGCQVLNLTTFSDSRACALGCTGINSSECLAACNQTYECLSYKCTPHLKLDIQLSNYDWTNKDNDTKLVFSYQLIGSGAKRQIDNDLSQVLLVGDFWMFFNTSSYTYPSCYNQTDCLCVGDNGTVSSEIVNSTEGNKFYVGLIFDHFADGQQVFNDPGFGFVNRTRPKISSDATQTTISFALVLLFMAYLLF